MDKRNNFKLPPGFKDQTKDINSDGDLIIWLSILKLAEEKKENIIFVSGEEKSDWVHRSEKQILYPHFKLQYEFQLINPNKSFYLIQLSELLRLFKVSYDIIEEIIKNENAQRIISSNIAAVSYNAESNTLVIEFINENIYEYYDVPEGIYQGLMSASSHGSYFDQYVKKGGYTYKKLR